MNHQILLLITIFMGLFFHPSLSTGKTIHKETIPRECPKWKNGEMEIHQISTNCGESSFLIFPDGTTLLIDAGDMRNPRYFPPVPDDKINPGERIARYVMSVNPSGQKVDYFLATHFHPDHIGDVASRQDRPKNEEGNFLLSGPADVARFLKFGKIIDRGWPDYNQPQAYNTSDPAFVNYKNFLDWEKKTKNTPIECFQTGSTSQFIPLHPNQYTKRFIIRNIACNGVIWNWRENRITDYVRANPQNLNRRVNENLLSAALLFTYGDFSYLSGGDLCGNLTGEKGDTINVEALFGAAAGKVDVCKSNHHGYHDAMVPEFIRQVNAKIYTMPVHDSAHLGEKVIPCLEKRVDAMQDKDAIIIPTYFPGNFRETYTSYNFINHIPPACGHIVIKVSSNGKTYSVYILDTNGKHDVKLKLGPFRS